MGEAFITRRGGTGGGPTSSDAILTVTVPAGSTVTATKGNITLTPTMWVQADSTLDCALFVIKPSLFDAQNTWTVTASLSGDTASAAVTIDANKQYDLSLSYGLYLFKAGKGALVDLGRSTYGDAGVTVGTAYISITGSNASTLYCANKINAEKYSTFNVDASISWVGGDGGWAGRAVVKSSLGTYPHSPSGSVASASFTADSVRRVYSVSISSLNQDYYFGYAGNTRGTIYNMWLEE